MFVDEAKKIVGSFESLGQLMGEYAQQRRGSIRIGALSIMCPKDTGADRRILYRPTRGSMSLVESGARRFWARWSETRWTRFLRSSTRAGVAGEHYRDSPVRLRRSARRSTRAMSCAAGNTAL